MNKGSLYKKGKKGGVESDKRRRKRRRSGRKRKQQRGDNPTHLINNEKVQIINICFRMNK